MEAKTSKSKSSRSLTVTLAITLFSLSAVVLLIVGGLYLYLNFQTQQAVVTSQQERERFKEAMAGKTPPEFLSTHPTDDNRIARLKELMPEAEKVYHPRPHP